MSLVRRLYRLSDCRFLLALCHMACIVYAMALVFRDMGDHEDVEEGERLRGPVRPAALDAVADRGGVLLWEFLKVQVEFASYCYGRPSSALPACFEPSYLGWAPALTGRLIFPWFFSL